LGQSTAFALAVILIVVSLWRWRTSNRMGVSGERETRAVHVTLVAQTHVPDEVFETLREQFSDEDRQAYVASGHYQPLEPDGDQLPGRASDELGKGELRASCQWGACGETAAAYNRELAAARHPDIGYPTDPFFWSALTK